MAIVSSSILGKKPQRSLRPKERSNYDQELDFLKTFDVDKRSYRDDFPGPSDLDSWQEVSVEDSDNESDVLDYLDYLHRRRIQLIRRGGTYTVLLVATWGFFTHFTGSPFTIALILLVLAGTNHDTSFAIRTMVQSLAGTVESTLERGQGNGSIPATPDTRDARDEFDSSPKTMHADTPRDPYHGIQSNWPKIRDGSEAPRHTKTGLHSNSPVSADNILRLARSFLVSQAVLQLILTLVQLIGAHYQHGGDTVGLLPRYWANLTSLRNIFGTGQLVTIAHYKFVSGWWWDWFVGIATLLVWKLPKAVIVSVWWACLNAIRSVGLLAVRDASAVTQE